MDLLAILLPAVIAAYVFGAPLLRQIDRTLRQLMPAGLQLLMLILAGPMLMIGAAAWLESDSFNQDVDLEALFAEMTPLPPPTAIDLVGHTDRGRTIPLYMRQPVDYQHTDLARRELHETEMRRLLLIRTAQPTPSYNCHGWVFTGGRCWLRRESVASILADNGYHEVSDPQVGDIIVYRNDAGEVLHTGLVRINADDLLLVESKWGPHGRYLHAPADQPYSDRWSFWHSERDGHLIHMDDSVAPHDTAP